jgi:hypothetical protein
MKAQIRNSTRDSISSFALPGQELNSLTLDLEKFSYSFLNILVFTDQLKNPAVRSGYKKPFKRISASEDPLSLESSSTHL